MSSSLAEEGASERAFERLYRRHHGEVYRFVLRDVRDPDEAEDVTQIAFLNAYRAMKRGDEPEKPRAWLLTIARNAARRSFRSRAVRPLELGLDSEAVAAPEREGPSGSEIRASLARLRPNYRAVLVLREIGGLSYAETAEMMGLTVSAVETLLFRARRALREELTRDEPERRVVVGGIALWPLSELFSNPVAAVAMWFGRQELAAKGAAFGGAAVLGTGAAAVQTGVVAVPDLGRQTPTVEQPAPASEPRPSGAAVAPTDGARPAATNQRKRAVAPASAPASASGEAVAPAAQEEEEEELEEPGESADTEPVEPGLELPDLNLPDAEEPPAGDTTSQVPELSDAPLPVEETPDATLPEPESPVPPPDTGDVLP
jgi:RNA polymerase sigma-70 factor, ECF subfamily